jgi:hypothetical protein
MTPTPAPARLPVGTRHEGVPDASVWRPSQGVRIIEAS